MGRDQPHLINVSENDSCPQVRFERELEVSSVGTLWLGRLTAGTEAGRVVLLRRLPKDLLAPKEVEGLAKVGEAYAKVRHPSLVKLLGVVEQDQDVICISEHLDGVRLHDLMRNAMDRDSPLPATVAVRIILDAGRAAVKAHRLAAELGLFPSTRLFVPEGVFVAAFGGTLLTEVGVLGAISRAEQPRTFPDLIAQLSPEEFQKAAPANGSPEVFSLGVLLWEALANRPLFTRDSRQRTLHELSTLAIDSLNNVERCGMPVPDSLAEVVRVATLRRSSERYQSVDAFVSALEQLPAHFVATEHQVASALREQACELM
ncbi:MAG TPA: protein kinase, partial [Polyangiaceae bacterium]